ncbi:hypothetical protein ACOMICROBIO_GDFFDHBD_01767 [Vibrio sp. B1REV9]|nr:hypothetical protein ACOMICROBIO_GDFFDHBD_01767 [Vibrio sp. B1REV9]
MRNVDISPLYRHAIGFDRLLNLVESNAKNHQQMVTHHTTSNKKTRTTTESQWQLQAFLKMR